jgi:hypothetical protein
MTFNTLLDTKGTKPSILFLQETCVSEKNVQELALPMGWQAACNAKPCGHMKGAALLIHNSLIPDKRELAVIYDKSNDLFDIIACRVKNMICISVYLHTFSQFPESFHENFIDCLMEIDGIDGDQQIIVAGDFNHPKKANILVDLMEAIDLFPISTAEETYISPNGVSSRLDWIFARYTNKVQDNVVDKQQRDHHILRAKVSLLPNPIVKQGANRINYKKLRTTPKEEIEELANLIENMILRSDSMSQVQEQLPDIALNHLGSRPNPRPRPDQNWLSQETRQARKASIRAWRQHREQQNDTSLNLAREANRRMKRLLRKKRREQKKRLGKLMHDNKLSIRTFIPRKGGAAHQSRLVQNPKELINFWRNLFHDIDKLITETNISREEPNPTLKFMGEDVKEIINNMLDKTPADDDIRLPLLKLLSDKALSKLAELYTKMGQCKILPSWAKTGIGRVLHKKGPRSDPSNYRVILLAPLFAKIYEKLLELKGRKFLKDEIMESIVEQGGFQQDRSIYDSIYLLQSARDAVRRRKGYLVVAFMDLRKAFDTVNHKKLLKTLKEQRAPIEWLNMLKPMLTERRMELCEELIAILKGTPQGSPISPLLFNFFINPLLKRLRCCIGVKASDEIMIRALGFADDIALIPNDIEDLDKMMKICEEWANEYGMSFSEEKSKIMLLEGTQKEGDMDISNLHMQLDWVDSFVYLGITIFGKKKGRTTQSQAPTPISSMWKAVFRLKAALDPNLTIPLEKQIKLLETDVLSIALYPAAVCDLDYKAIDKFINKQLRRLIGIHGGQSSSTFLRSELGVLPSKFLAHKRALGYLWHLFNKAWFRHHIANLEGIGPYMRLRQLAQKYKIDLLDIQICSKEGWMSKVNKAVLEVALEDWTTLSKEKGVPEPSKDFKANKYIMLGGGLAKHGVEYRWSLVKRNYFAPATERSDEINFEEERCDECKTKHPQLQSAVSASVRIKCRKLCNDSFRVYRKKTLLQVSKEAEKREVFRVLKSSTDLINKMNWPNQTKEVTRKVMILVKKSIALSKSNMEMRTRIGRVLLVAKS